MPRRYSKNRYASEPTMPAPPNAASVKNIPTIMKMITVTDRLVSDGRDCRGLDSNLLSRLPFLRAIYVHNTIMQLAILRSIRAHATLKDIRCLIHCG